MEGPGEERFRLLLEYTRIGRKTCHLDTLPSLSALLPSLQAQLLPTCLILHICLPYVFSCHCAALQPHWRGVLQREIGNYAFACKDTTPWEAATNASDPAPGAAAHFV